jgi:hypothetical protein
LFLKEVVRLHGLPNDITFDREPQFVSNFWQQLLQTFSTFLNLSSAHHPQTNGQTERVNQILEQYLQCSLSYQQEGWVHLLPMAEFAYNNPLHGSIGVTSFFANYGLHPCFSISILSDSVSPSAEERARTLADIHSDLTFELHLASERHKEQANLHRSVSPTFEVGNFVWLLCQARLQKVASFSHYQKN